MKRSMETMETEGGNTNPPPKKRCVPSKRWCFTWNNYPSTAMETLETVFKEFDVEWVVGREVGEQGTPHLQGYIESKQKIRPVEKLKLPTELHWEKCKGNRAANVEYCTKDGEYSHSPELKPPRKLQLITPDRWWQQDIVKLVQTEPDDRSVHWYWETTGCIGKTQLCKYLTVKHGAITLGGKGADVRNGIVEYLKTNGKTPDIVLVNLVRSNEQFVSYEALENIKDMYFYSGKYEGGMVCGPPPHLIIFANFRPDTYKLSADRWHITELSDDVCPDTCLGDSTPGLPPNRPSPV